MRTSTTIRKKTEYQKLVSRKKAFCQGKATKADVKRASDAYVKNAVAKATKSGISATKAKSAATQKAKRVLTKGCKISSNIAGKKKVTRAKKA